MFGTFFQKKIPLLYTVLLSVFCTCCSQYNYHGNYIDQKMTNNAESIKMTKSEMINTFGRPSFVSAFDQNIWYYIQVHIKRKPSTKPKAQNIKLAQITFDSDDMVSNVHYYDKNATPIQFDSSITPFIEAEPSFINRIKKNFKRFKPSENIRPIL